MKKTELKLGNRVKDVVSGFEGIATQKLEYIDGRCDIGVIPKSSKNTYPDVKWIPIGHIEKVDDGIHIEPEELVLGFHVKPKGAGKQ